MFTLFRKGKLRMRKSKPAFTLAELVLMLGLISIVISMVISATNPFAPKYKSLFYYNFVNTRGIVGDLVASSSNGLLPDNDTLFCVQFTKDLNMIGVTPDCSNFFSGTKNSPFLNMSESNFDQPNFALTNGQRFYISTRVDEPPVGYRILNVDLNGKAKPNKFEQDVVSFIVYDTGEIFPLGKPAEDKDYLTVNAKVYNGETGTFTGTYLEDEKNSKFLAYRTGYCLSGYKTSFANYCDETPPFTSAVAVSEHCNPTLTNNFCRVGLVKPVLKVNI